MYKLQLAIHPLSEDLQPIAEIWRKALQLPIWDGKASIAGLLEVTEKGLQLQLHQEHAPGPIRVDFISGALNYRCKHGGGKGQAIAKAVGLKKGRLPTVLDATAGLGSDAFVLASLGCQVTLLERSPIVAALLQDGLQRAIFVADIAEIVARMQLIQQDSNDYIQQLPPAQKPEVIYLDPMFPARKKTAIAKKEMQILQCLLEEADQEILPLFITALQCAKKRVVIKRPRQTTLVGNISPSFQVIGKSSRFDVYVK